MASKRQKFQSTLPVWGGTKRQKFNPDRYNISIHPPRVGRDKWRKDKKGLGFIFQSTLPVWGGTFSVLKILDSRNISIHPPRVGRDRYFPGKGGC